jgi:hypothetical protein
MNLVTRALFVSFSLIFAAAFVGMSFTYRYLEGGLSQTLTRPASPHHQRGNARRSERPTHPSSA